MFLLNCQPTYVQQPAHILVTRTHETHLCLSGILISARLSLSAFPLRLPACRLAQARQMQALIVAARAPGRRLAARLQVDLPILAGARELTHKKVELPAVAAARARDDGVALERPRGCRARVRERQRLVRRRVGPNV